MHGRVPRTADCLVFSVLSTEAVVYEISFIRDLKALKKCAPSEGFSFYRDAFTYRYEFLASGKTPVKPARTMEIT